jgi:hypothetical protein
MRYLSTLLLLILFAGCWNNRIGEFSVISTQGFELNSDYVLLEKGTMGVDIQYIFVVVPSQRNISIESAVDDALRDLNGHIMTDVTARHQGFFIPYFYGENRIVVEGDVWRRSDTKYGDVMDKIDEVYTVKNGEIVLQEN